MPLAAKHFDLVIGIDVHIVQPPGTVPPTPVPHPFAGIIFDPFDYLPVFGATVLINGFPRAQAGSAGMPIPSHIPIGGVFVRPPDNECELFMGSSTVLVEGEPQGYMGLPVLSCSDIGGPPPPRPPKDPGDVDKAGKAAKKKKPKKKGPVSMVLPTSAIFPIPSGKPVLVGGPPTISLSALAGRAIFALGAGALRKLQNTKRGIEFSRRMHQRADEIFEHLGVSESTRNLVHKGLCSLTGHPVDIATGKVLTEAVDIELPGPLPLIFERTWYSTSVYRGPLGHGWHHVFDLALMIDNDLTVVRLADGRLMPAPGLQVGESWFCRREKLELRRELEGWTLRDRQGTRYCFANLDLPPEGPGGGVVELGAVEDRSGNRIELLRDEGRRLSAIVDSGGRRLPVRCDNEGRILEIRGPHPDPGRHADVSLVRYVYDRTGELVEVHDALGAVTRYAYRNHLLVRETNRNGLSFHFEYDEAERCVRTWGDGGIYDHRLEYADDHTIVENSLKVRETYFFNGDGLVTRAVDALGHEAAVSFDEWTNKLSETDELGRKTRYVYDERGRLTEQIWPDGTTARFAYDESDQLVRAIDQNGSWWQWIRDERGRLLARHTPDGATTRLVWSGPRSSAIIDARGGVTSLEYDQAGNLVRAQLPSGGSFVWSHDRLGRVVHSLRPTGAAQVLRRDLAGRVLEVHEADSGRRTFARDGEGRTLKISQPSGEIRFSWAGLGQLKRREEGEVTTCFDYDGEERLVGLTNAQGGRYRFERDLRGDVIAEVAWAGDRRELERDAAGQIVKIRQPSGAEVEYGWTRTGALERVAYGDGSFERFVYREDGLMMLADNEVCRVKFERDPLGRITREWQDEHWVASLHEPGGGRVGLRSSFGVELDIELDAMGRWSGLRLREGEEERWRADTQRDVVGYETERRLPGGARDRWVRDALSRPTQHQVWNGRAVIRDMRHDWDVDDRLKQVLDAVTGQRTEYRHDALGRLAWARRDDGTELRIPDVLGNLYRSAERVDRFYGADGRLLRAEEREGTEHYEYDADGRRVRKTEPDGGEWRYRWNAAGRLVAVVRPDGEELSFAYDALGRRVWKRFRGRTTRWLWDGDVILHEWVEGGELEVDRSDAAPTEARPRQSREGDPHRPRGPPRAGDDDDRTAFVAPAFVPPPKAEQKRQEHGFVSDEDRTGYVEPAFVTRARMGPQVVAAPAGLVTWVSDPETGAPTAKLVGGRACSVVCDHLGTPVLMLDEAGRRVWAAEVSTWGEVRVLVGEAGDCPHRFAGQYEDVETGLAYNRYRYYDPRAGQYLCVDPIRLAGGLNSFAYVGDPLTERDPLGLASTGGDGCGKLGPGDQFNRYIDGSDGLLSELGTDGFLDLYIKTGPTTPRGGQMFNEAMEAFGNNVKGVRGTWIGGGELADNFDAFKAATKTLIPEQAAFETFTGHMAHKYGFTKARIVSNEAKKVVVEFHT